MVEREIALYIKERALRAIADLDGLIYDVRDRCSDEDFQMIRRGAGLAMAKIITDLLEPIYKQHPEIDDLRDEE
jgi:hypothetical protein